MKLKIRNPEDFWAGLMFIGFGVLVVFTSFNYPTGTVMRMGPGFFPIWLGALLIILGAITSAISFTVEGAPITPFAWKPMIMLSLSFMFFGWGVDHIGFVPSLFGLIVLCTAAGQVFRLIEVLILSVVLIVGSVGIFIYGIGLEYPLFWWR